MSLPFLSIENGNPSLTSMCKSEITLIFIPFNYTSDLYNWSIKWKLLFTEEAIPSDFDLIDKSYDFDTELKRYTPTVEFAKYAFNKLNSEIFESKLPINKVTFKTKSFSEVIKDALGCVIPNERGKSGYIWKYDLYLNTNIKLSIHRWYEVVLHEMFHIYEDECFPENKTKPKYDPPPTENGFHINARKPNNMVSMFLQHLTEILIWTMRNRRMNRMTNVKIQMMSI